MIHFPNCKINLGLNVIRKREDGFHDIETIFYPVSLYDAIEVVPQQEKNNSPAVNFSYSGAEIPGSHEDNLCLKAYYLLKKHFPALPSANIHLHKAIPTGAGLGGGSADASFMLKLLNKKFALEIPDDKLSALSLELGSDCPFFILNKPCYATGRGEELEEISLDLSTYKLIIVKPPCHISTAEVFAKMIPSTPAIRIKEVIHKPVQHWRNELKNDFEAIVFKQFPDIKKVKEDLYAAGAIYASMSGSGSAVYGLFEKNNNPQLTFPKDFFVRSL